MNSGTFLKAVVSGARPETNRPIPLGQLSEEEHAIIKNRYPELFEGESKK